MFGRASHIVLLAAVAIAGCDDSEGSGQDSNERSTARPTSQSAGSVGATETAASTASSGAGSASSGPETGTSESGTEDTGPNIGGGDHQDILDDVMGFGRDAQGGTGGALVHVTTLADSGPGSLREAVQTEGPAWVVFDVSGEIDLQRHLDVDSYKTIDGRGADVTISGYGLRVRAVDHIVITHMKFDSGADDAIKLIEGTHDVWVNQSSFADWGDGLIDITRGATDVTISACHFTDHNTVMLIGASPQEGDTDVNIRVTLYGNYFDDTNQRHPHIRFGRLHAFNNYYRGWGHSGIQYNYEAQVVSESNVFEPETDSRAILHRWEFDMKGNPGSARSIDDLLLDGAATMEYQPDTVFSPEYPYDVETASETLAAEIAADAGYQAVPLP